MVVDHPWFHANDVAKWSLGAELASQIVAVPRAGFAQRQESQDGVFGRHSWTDGVS
jgi:hypothetical protein